MIIDAHTHIEGLPGCPWLDPPEMILGLLDEAGIQRAAVMTYVDAPLAHPSYDPLLYVRQAIESYPHRLIGFARIDPGHPSARQLLRRAVREWGFKGLKLHPSGYRQPPDSEATLQLLRSAAEIGVPALFHCGDEDFTLPLEIARAAEQCPDTPIILGHMGGYFHVEDAIAAAERLPNLYLETSATPHPRLIAEALDRIGPKRVIYGSDGPGCDPRIELHKIRLTGVTGEAWDRVTGANFLELIGEA